MASRLRWVWGGLPLFAAICAGSVASAQELDGLLDQLRDQVQGSELQDYLPQVDVTADPNSMSSEAGAHARRLLFELDKLLAKGAEGDDAARKPVEATEAPGAGVVYMDESGAARRAESLQQVPEKHRAHAVPAPPAEQPVEAPPPREVSKAPQKVYRYRGENGRTLYTNVEEQIPLAERVSAEVSLSHVPLNSALGTEINKRLLQAHEALVESRFCEQVRSDGAEATFAASAPSEAGPLDWIKAHIPMVVCGALLFLLFAVTPAMLRKVDPQAWRRVLMFAIPALTVGAYLGQLLSAAPNMTVAKSVSAGCEPETFSALGESASPLKDRFILVKSLQRQMAEVDAIHGDATEGK